MARIAKAATSKIFNSKATREVEFKFFAPLSKKVCVGGTFNNWKAEKNPLKKDTNGTWKGTVNLTPGRYEYRYWIDGEWQSAQEPVECVPNAFGSWNCVIEVC